MIKYTRILSYVLVCTFLVYPRLSFGASDISAHTSYTWASDLEWGAWSFSNIETNGSNSGIRLANKTSGGYEISGEATYKFSPGGKNSWVAATVKSQEAVEVAAEYLWSIAPPNDSIIQATADSGQIIKKWEMEGSPTYLVAGCDSDVWVVNRSLETAPAEASLSHLVSREGKVVTRRLPPSLSWPSAIALECNTDPAEIRLLANGYIVRIDANQFDQLGENDPVVPTAQIGPTIPVDPGELTLALGHIADVSGDILNVYNPLEKEIYYTVDILSSEISISESQGTSEESGQGQEALVRSFDTSTGTALNIQYSTDGVNYYSAQSDGAMPNEVSLSEDLYIKVIMTGSGTNSPLLESLKIEYDPESFSSLAVSRHTYKSVLGRNSDDTQTTFDKGEKVFVRIKLFEPERARDSVTLIERFSNVEGPTNFKLKRNCTGEGDAVAPDASSDNQLNFTLDIPLGLSCLDYEYEIK